MFVVIHLWPNDKPTIMPEVFRSYNDARNHAINYANGETKPGHSYVAVTLPGDIIETLTARLAA